MTPAEEDALVKSCWKLEANQYTRYQHLSEDKIRLAIRAAYAQGREDAAKDVRPLPCDVKVHNTLFRAGVESWAVSAAIERQREYGPTEESFGIAAAMKEGK